MENLKAQRNDSRKELCTVDGELKYQLICFGDHLAKREGYKEHDGLEALHFYLIQKYQWTPAQAFSLSDNDLRFLFAEEMSGWTVAKEARR